MRPVGSPVRGCVGRWRGLDGLVAPQADRSMRRWMPRLRLLAAARFHAVAGTEDAVDAALSRAGGDASAAGRPRALRARRSTRPAARPSPALRPWRLGPSRILRTNRDATFQAGVGGERRSPQRTPATMSLRVPARSGTPLPLNRHRPDTDRHGLVTDRSPHVTRHPTSSPHSKRGERARRSNLIASAGGRASVGLVSSWLDMDIALAAGLLSRY